jgi:hypothetical protein
MKPSYLTAILQERIGIFRVEYQPSKKPACSRWLATETRTENVYAITQHARGLHAAAMSLLGNRKIP